MIEPFVACIGTQEATLIRVAGVVVAASAQGRQPDALLTFIPVVIAE
jgi:hypothetical protein